MRRGITTRATALGAPGLLVGALAACLLVLAATASADGGSLQAKVAGARSQAGALAGELQAKQGQLAAAQQQAAAASAREQQLSGLLAKGQRRAADLAGRVKVSQRHLVFQQARLQRARHDLAQRLVAIYESGSPSTAGVILGASSFKELATQSEYLREIESS